MINIIIYYFVYFFLETETVDHGVHYAEKTLRVPERFDFEHLMSHLDSVLNHITKQRDELLLRYGVHILDAFLHVQQTEA